MRKFKRNYGDFWVLKCDISKFFYSIDPYILFNIMKKYISDKELLSFTNDTIFDKEILMTPKVFLLEIIQVSFLQIFI